MRADLPMPAWWPATPNAIPLAGRQPPPRGTHPCSCSRGRVPGRPRQTPRAARIQTGPLDMLCPPQACPARSQAGWRAPHRRALPGTGRYGMTGDIRRHQQESIIAELGGPAEFDAQDEVQHRVRFLVERLRETGTRGYVLGISGGVDSCTAGRLCQLAVERAREGGGQARFIAMRLPYGVQA